MLPYSNAFSWRNLRRFIAGGLAASALAACGGGGGSPGTIPGAPVTVPGTTTPVPASVTLDTSSATIVSSGAVGTEVTLTAIVKDANNRALAGATVSFKSDSGTISNSGKTTDVDGKVVEKISVQGDPTPRAITITASSGGVTSVAKVVTVTATASITPKLLLTASSGTLPSSGSAGTGVTIRALVLDTNNVVVPNTTVTFSTDSGSLSAAQKQTDALGVASVTLDTGTDPTTRTITVSANLAGIASNVKVNVVGTKISISAATTVNSGAASDVTVTLVDSSGAALPNRTVTFSAQVNPLVVKGGGGAVTDSLGKLVLSYTASNATNDVVTVRALGETATASIAIGTSNFTITAVDGSGNVLASANTDICNRIMIRNFVGPIAQGGTIAVSSSRGTVYTDAICSVVLTGRAPMVSGVTQVYVKANSPGVATLTANSDTTNSTVQGSVEFVAPLTSSAVISLQGSPAVVGFNLPGSTTQQVTLRAVVTDKASQGNPVKNAKVVFSIDSDPSGGVLSQPNEVLTGSDGSATVSYIAGATPTAVDGVVVRARIDSPGVSTAFNTAKLTVAQKALFISAGTGNTVLLPNSATYQVDYVVFVTDAAGNAARDVAVTGAVRPRNYMKGTFFLATATGPWVRSLTTTCANEDIDSDGVLGIGEDINGNGQLDPGIPVTITSSGKTDASGTAIISLVYPRDRAYWVDVDFTIRGEVAGSEARYVGYTLLPGLASDYINVAVSPPGVTSPYGKSSVCTNSN